MRPIKISDLIGVIDEPEKEKILQATIGFIKSYKGIKGELPEEYNPAVFLLFQFFKDQYQLSGSPIIKSEKADNHSVEYAIEAKNLTKEIPKYILNLIDRIVDKKDNKELSPRIRGY